MPIHTLFRTGVRYPRLGVIRLGGTFDSGRKNDKNEPIMLPREYDYFVVPPELAAVERIGEKPKAIEVSFPSDRPADIFDPWFTRYDGPLLTARCDGVTCTVIPKEGEETTKACGRPERGPAKCPQCGARALGRLNVIVRFAKVMGIYQVLIGGFERCKSITTELKMYERTGLSHRWFDLTRDPAAVQIRTETGKRLSREGYPVHIWLKRSPDTMLGPSMDEPPAALAAASDPRALTAGAPGGDEAAEPDDEVPPELRDNPPAEPEEWDVSYCYAQVRRWGVDADTYGRYLDQVYLSRDNVSAKGLAQQREKIEAAQRSPDERATFVAAVRKVAGKPKPRAARGATSW